MKLIVVALSSLLSLSVVAAELNETSQREINHLFEFIRSSSCDFNRNGTWYKASEAADHIDKKYQYFMKKEMIGSAADFIALSATQSSMSGKAYTVRCGEDAEITSAEWLNGELKRFQEQQ